jgi:hypothetical protein
MGREITPEQDTPGMRHAKGLTYEMYVIRHPTSGTRQLHLYGDELPLSGEAVDVRIFTEGKDLVYLPMVADTNTNKYRQGGDQVECWVDKLTLAISNRTWLYDLAWSLIMLNIVVKQHVGCADHF